MGWTSFEFHGTREEFARQEFGERIVDLAVVGSTIYIAWKCGGKYEGKICAMIVLTKINNKEDYNFSYKEMDEGCGPNESKCPKRILKLLSPVEEVFPPDGGYAKAWRERCNTPAPKAIKLETGTIIQTAEVLKFKGGYSFDFFKLLQPNIWQPLDKRGETYIGSTLRVKFKPSRFPFTKVA